MKTAEQNRIQHALYRQRHPDRLKAAQRAYYLANRERLVLRQREYNTANRERVQARKRFALYGLTHDEYEAKLDEQGGVCALCHKPEGRTRTNTGRVLRLAVDHDHATGLVRGLLCFRCNGLLGRAEDDPDHLRAAADYIVRYRT